MVRADTTLKVPTAPLANSRIQAPTRDGVACMVTAATLPPTASISASG